MAQYRSPREVFLALVEGVAEERWGELPDLYAEQTHVVHPFDPQRGAPLRSRDEIRNHFTPADGPAPRLRRRPTNITIHDTADSEVIVAEFEYRGTVIDTGEPFAVPCVFVMRVRDGEIVSSRDYIDPIASARVRGQLDAVAAGAATDQRPESSQC